MSAKGASTQEVNHSSRSWNMKDTWWHEITMGEITFGSKLPTMMQVTEANTNENEGQWWLTYNIW